MATDIGRLYAIIGADTSEFNRKMTAIGKKMGAVGKRMTMMLTLPILALGAAAVKSGADFEYAMTNAWAVTGEGEEALAAMTAKAREMGATTIFSARQAADAMYYMASAGWDSKKMADAIKPTLDLAAATQSDLAFATEAVISSMNQFQISTKDTGRVTNVFASAIMNSQATLEKLKISMTYAGPIANSLGKSIEETTAILMGMYNAGYEASTAGTALRMGLAKLLEGSNRTKQGLAGLGLSLKDVNPEMNSLTDIVKRLEERGAKAADVIKIFGVRAGPAFAALIAQGSDKLKEFEKDVTGTNAAAEMAEKQIKTFKGSIKLLTSILNEASIQIFQVLGPIIKDLVDNKIRPAVKAFTELSKEKKATILKVIGLVAALGPMLMILGKMVTIGGALIPVIQGLGKALIFLATNPVGMVITAIAVVVALFIKWRAEQRKVEAMQIAQDKATRASARHVMAALELVGETSKKYIELRKAYGGNTTELFKAIKAEKHGKELKEALLVVLEKERAKRIALRKSQREQIEADKEARLAKKDLEKALADYEKGTLSAETAADKFKKTMEDLGLVTIPEKKARIEELGVAIKNIDKMYKDGEITLTDYKKALEELRTEIMNLTTGLDSKFSPAAISAQAALIGLAISSRLAKEGIVEDLGDQEVKLESYQEAWNDMVIRMSDSLMSFGELTGTIFQNMGKIFSNFVGAFIKGLGKMVIAEMMFAKKSIFAKKMKAISSAIASVFDTLPWFLAIPAAAVMFGVVGALFAKLTKFGKGGDVWKPTVAVVGEEGPEVIRRRPDYMRELATARAEGGSLQKIIVQNRITIGEQTFYKESVKSIKRAGNEREITVPNDIKFD